MAQLEDFSAARVRVQDFLRVQRASIRFFWDNVDEVFFRTFADKEDAPTTRVKTEGVHRLTSTVTCIESLLEAPASDVRDGEAWTNAHGEQVLQDFMSHALTTTEGWQSDSAAWVYCRVRTIGCALRLLGANETWDAPRRNILKQLLTEAWKSRYDAGGSFGLRESTGPPESNPALQQESGPRQYPANAFLTYWGLLAATLAEKEGLLPTEEDADSEFTSRRARNAALDWLRECLAAQVAFHFSGATFVDPQQLAWSLCGLVRFSSPSALANAVSVEHELLVAGLRAFFEQQKRKTWETGAPLFHYANAGNAYAYVYETLAELVCLATSKEVPRSAADTLADLLKGYSVELMKALQHAEATGQSLDGIAVGWSSGHHPHRNSPESWATASVFRFAQGLRRLVGTWSSDAAKVALGARKASGNEVTLNARGGTWNLGMGTAGSFLSTAFVHPVQRATAIFEPKSRVWLDPDEQILEQSQARSAMLFGPPGTGKTTLIDAVAGAIGWDFIEITPAQFLDRGVDYVSAQADVIFRQVMELDHCVILLDEIDELIHQRNAEAETIERFFTTTMLPRLAKLWEARRVLFFVNTNNIRNVDSAIVRSQRFDAARLVLPPGFASKREAMLHDGFTIDVSEQKVNDALLRPEKVPPQDAGVGWLALIRYDQYDAVKRELRKRGASPRVVSAEELKASLSVVAKELNRLDWHEDNSDDGDVDRPEDAVVPLPNVAELAGFQRTDARMIPWAFLDVPEAELSNVLNRLEVGAGGSKHTEHDGRHWVSVTDPDNPESWAAAHDLSLRPDGVLEPMAKQADGAEVTVDDASAPLEV